MEKNQPYKQDKVFDNILETEEFNVYTKIDDLPLDENPMYLEEGINGICTGGSALFNVFGNKRRIVSNDLVVIFPFQLASVTEISSDFSMTFLKVPKSLFMDTISGICIPMLDFFFYILKSATKLFSVLLASKRPLITELADKLRLKYPRRFQIKMFACC